MAPILINSLEGNEAPTQVCVSQGTETVSVLWLHREHRSLCLGWELVFEAHLVERLEFQYTETSEKG